MGQIKNQLNRKLGPEELAYLYQNLGELAHFFLPDSYAYVEIKKKRARYVVNFHLTGFGAEITSQGVAKSFYKAISIAKSHILSHLHSIQQEVTSEEDRNQEMLHQKNALLH